MKSFYEMLLILSEESDEERKKRAKEDYYRVERERAAQARREEQEEFRKKRKEAEKENPYGKQSPIFSPDWMDYAKSLEDQDLVTNPYSKFSEEVDKIICDILKLSSSRFRGLEIPCGLHVFFPDAHEDEVQERQLDFIEEFIYSMYTNGYEAKDVANQIIIMLKKMKKI